MKPWMTVLSSAAAAVFVTAAILFPELGSAPRSAVPPIVLAHLPVLAVAALAIFGLCAILITATTLVAGIVRLRQQLARAATDGLAAGRELSSVFAGELRRLAPNPALTLAQSDRPGGNVASAIPLRASEARKEIARLYYISLARTHVLSAQIILAGIVGLGIAQDYGSLPLQPGRIPTVSAVLIMIGLLLLGILGRIAVDVTAEPLLETIAELRAEPSEVGLLRRAVELLDLACSGGAVDRRMQAPPPQLSEQVVASIERGHQAMLDAVAGLSATTRTLEATARSVADSLEATVRMAASQQQPANDEKLVAATTAFLQLQPAIEELTAVLRGLGPMTGQREATTPAAEPAPDTRVTPRVATELRRLLQEIDAG